MHERGQGDVGDRMVRVLELDSELGLGVPPDRLEVARASLVAPHRAFAPGSWEVPHGQHGHTRLGFLLLAGFVARDVTLAGKTATELLGEGDIIPPPGSRTEDTLLRHKVVWHVLEPASVAVLDDRFARVLMDWPTVLSALLEREVRRTSRMAIHQALLQLSPVETRLLLIFWHLAERWGRVSPAGITLRLRLPHHLLGRLVGCRRASVTTALRHIYESGLVVKRADGTWLLRGSPPDELAHVHWDASGWRARSRIAGMGHAPAGIGQT